MNEKFPYCLYFGGELECPELMRRNRFDFCLWKAEREACLFSLSGGRDFLACVVDFVNRAGLGRDVSSVGRYVAMYPFCGEREKSEIVRRYEVDGVMEFQRPRGWTVFENRWREYPSSEFGGLSLYRDGRVYELLGARYPKSSLAYVLLGICKPLAEEVRELIISNWDFFRCHPSKEGCRHFVTERYEYLKFLSRRFNLFLRRCARDGHVLIIWTKKILKLALKYGFLMDFDQNVSLEFFVEKWILVMEDIMAGLSRRKKYRFLGMEFAQDCRRLGFDIDGKGLSDTDLERENDYFRLGNRIFGLWKSLSSGLGNAAVQFDPGWIKAALVRLGELGSKGFYKLKPV